MLGFVMLIILAAVGWFAYQNYRREQLLTKSRLRDLLKAKNFKEADIETRRILLHISNRQSVGYLRDEDILNLSCQNLREIDQLWSQYSNGKFGYTAQKKIWKKHGINLDSTFTTVRASPYVFVEEISKGFPSEVGWLGSLTSDPESVHHVKTSSIKYFRQLDFSLKASEGHLPTHIRFIDMEYNAHNGYSRLKNPAYFYNSYDERKECSITDAVYVCGMKGENHNHFSKALATKMDSCGF